MSAKILPFSALGYDYICTAENAPVYGAQVTITKSDPGSVAFVVTGKDPAPALIGWVFRVSIEVWERDFQRIEVKRL